MKFAGRQIDRSAESASPRFARWGLRLNQKGNVLMTDHVYRIIDMAGSSEVSHADAIENALARASKTLRHVRWFEVTQMRGDIQNGKPHYYQVMLKVGFTMEDGSDQVSDVRS